MSNVVNDTIDQGATFYRVVSLFTDAAKKTVYDLTNKTPRATLMTSGGQHVADFGCAIKDNDPSQGIIIWTMPRSITANLVSSLTYLYNIDLDDADGITTDRALSGQITVKTGQIP